MQIEGSRVITVSGYCTCCFVTLILVLIYWTMLLTRIPNINVCELCRYIKSLCVLCVCFLTSVHMKNKYTMYFIITVNVYYLRFTNLRHVIIYQNSSNLASVPLNIYIP